VSFGQESLGQQSFFDKEISQFSGSGLNRPSLEQGRPAGASFDMTVRQSPIHSDNPSGVNDILFQYQHVPVPEEYFNDFPRLRVDELSTYRDDGDSDSQMLLLDDESTCFTVNMEEGFFLNSQFEDPPLPSESIFHPG
jgi:hypothetical protein